MILVSACLAGLKCRYDGASATREDIVELVRKGKALPVCPEVLGGLSTPRGPAEIYSSGSGHIARVIDQNGQDVTSNFQEGARETLRICRKLGIRQAILKQGSPSCGCGEIYDGTFTGRKIAGDGITAAFLKENGIEVCAI